MDDPLLVVQMLESPGNLGDDVAAKILGKVRQSHDLMEQFAAGAQFQDKVVISLLLLEIDELDNIGMIQSAHYRHFFENICPLVRITSARLESGKWRIKVKMRMKAKRKKKQKTKKKKKKKKASRVADLD